MKEVTQASSSLGGATGDCSPATHFGRLIEVSAGDHREQFSLWVPVGAVQDRLVLDPIAVSVIPARGVLQYRHFCGPDVARLRRQRPGDLLQDILHRIAVVAYPAVV